MIEKFRDLFPRSVEKELLIGDQITDEECAKRLHLIDHCGPDDSDVKYNKKFIHRQILIKAIKK